MSEAILTFDLGTTRLKIALFDLNGELLGQISERHKEYMQGLNQWQSADDWWESATRLTRKLIHKAQNNGALQLIACSLSGRAGAGVFIDTHGKVLYQPWLDNRHSKYLRQIIDASSAQIEEARETRKGGTEIPEPISNYGATLLAKFLWLKDEQPELAKKTRHLLYAKDFLLFKLTGKAYTDPASGPDRLKWNQSILNKFSLDEAILPTPGLPWELVGETQEGACKALGIPKGIPVALGAHDGICANVGAGSTNPGQFAITLGTHAVVRAISDRVPSDSTRFYGLPPDKHVIGGNALMAGRAVDWFVDNWTQTTEDKRADTFKLLNNAAEKIPPGSNGLSFFPYLAGQIAPEMRRKARAAFYGLSLNTCRDDMFRAVLEGSSFAIAEVFDQVVGWVGEPVSIGLTGSGADSSPWVEIITNILQKPVCLSDGSAEGRGAAIFAAIATGYYGNVTEATRAMVDTSNVSEPDISRAGVYSELFERWQRLNEGTKAFDE